MKMIKLGMIGFGTIGAGVAKILMSNSEIIRQRLGKKALGLKLSIIMR